MKIHLIKEKTILMFINKNAQSRIPLIEWLDKLKSADWVLPNDIKKVFKTADFLGEGSNRVVFNIGGNNYRIIAKCLYGKKKTHLFICWIGTHAEYTKICSENKQYTIKQY